VPEKKKKARSQRRKDSAEDIIKTVLNSPIGQTLSQALDEKLRHVLGLGSKPAPENIRVEADGIADRIKREMNADYATLGVDPGAEDIVLKKAYQTLAAKYHPDNPKTGDAKKMTEINVAYDRIWKERNP